ncbi:hypothetical protein ACWEPB_37800 [Kitasatospora cineracea]
MGGGGRGGKGNKGGNRFVSPTRFGAEGEEDEELYGDAGILGQAADVDPRDRQWHRARRRWLDDARADGTFTTAEPEPATVAPAGPASENDMINQLAGVLLGGGAATPDGTGTDDTPTTDSTPDTDRTSGGTPAADPTTARTDTSASTRTGTQAEGADRTDDAAYLERSRSAAARRGHPDAPAATTAPAPAAEGAAAAPQRAPLREEGGFQVPSPFLRAALSRLAAPAAD